MRGALCVQTRIGSVRSSSSGTSDSSSAPRHGSSSECGFLLRSPPRVEVPDPRFLFRFPRRVEFRLSRSFSALRAGSKSRPSQLLLCEQTPYGRRDKCRRILRRKMPGIRNHVERRSRNRISQPLADLQVKPRIARAPDY